MNPLLQKLQAASRLTRDDEAVLAGLTEPVHLVGRGDIQPEGAEGRFVGLVLEGWACRYKQLENGKRQITSVLLPGDLCEPFGTVPPFLDYTLGALTTVGLVRLAPQAIRNAVQASPRIEEALWRDLLVSDAIGREHIVNLGRRSATERLGHFFCEIHLRLGVVGLADGTSFDLPLTQADLADLFGLSAVHVNRSLQELRGSGLISLRDRRATIRDLGGLRDLSMFDPGYLRLGGAERA